MAVGGDLNNQVNKYPTIWTNLMIKSPSIDIPDWGLGGDLIKFEVEFPTLGTHFLFKN